MQTKEIAWWWMRGPERKVRSFRERKMMKKRNNNKCVTRFIKKIVESTGNLT